jgi:hypothetical protein
VQRSGCADKIAWQQDHASHEIEGWCELCEAACNSECGAWCLFDFSATQNRNLLFPEISRNVAERKLPRQRSFDVAIRVK